MYRPLIPLLLALAMLPAAETAKGDRVGAAFNHIDADKNGSISKQEWMPLRTKFATSGKFQAQHPKAYDKADTNDDGQLSQDEIASFPHWPGFDRFDADKDGSISRAEWNALAPELQKAFAASKAATK